MSNIGFVELYDLSDEDLELLHQRCRENRNKYLKKLKKSKDGSREERFNCALKESWHAICALFFEEKNKRRIKKYKIELLERRLGLDKVDEERFDEL